MSEAEKELRRLIVVEKRSNTSTAFRCLELAPTLLAELDSLREENVRLKTALSAVAI